MKKVSAYILGALLLLSAMYCEGLGSNPRDAALGSMDDRGDRSKERDQRKLMSKEETTEDGLVKGIYATGSSLPDCSHACGACFPCKTVMVSFKCFVAESCPIVYRCMCKGKYYHVPSN